VHKLRKPLSVSLIASVAMSCGATFAVAGTHKPTNAAYYLKPDPHAGDIVSDITYRVIATHGPGMDDNVWQVPATGPTPSSIAILQASSSGPFQFAWTGR